MQIRYTGPTEELSVAPAGKEGFIVARLKWVDVDDEVAKGLLDQPHWEKKKAPSGAADNNEEN